MGDFRRNVDPDVRRKTNKSLLELKEFQLVYKACRAETDKCDKRLQAENEKLNSAAVALEDARNMLSNAQEEIDSDYLPEGAQPRARIQQRDELALVSNPIFLPREPPDTDSNFPFLSMALNSGSPS
jgi:hypothetical protein